MHLKLKCLHFDSLVKNQSPANNRLETTSWPLLRAVVGGTARPGVSLVALEPKDGRFKAQMADLRSRGQSKLPKSAIMADIPAIMADIP